MKQLKFLAVLLFCAGMCLLSGCSSTNKDNEPMAPYGGGSGDLQSIDAAGGAGGLGSDAFGRTGNEWSPIEGVKMPVIYFAFDQSRIGSSEVPKLETTAKYMKDNSTIGLIIQGNCDERGSHEYNIGLGERRALAVREFLAKLGVQDSRMQTISYGSERPADPGHNEASWMKNRRADLVPAKMN